MTEKNKPEWFEIVDSDGPATAPKASKTLPVAAVMAAALIIGIGAVVGQVQQESPANAVQENIAPVVSSTAAATVASTARLANPSIATLPTNGEDEDDDEYEEDDDHDDDDDEDEYEDD